MAFKIPVEDRISTYPGRITLTPVSGQTNTYDMVRADLPVAEGTPMNKALFDNKAYTLTKDATVYVTKSGNDVSGDGSVAAPFATIQAAIDALPKHLGGYTAIIDIGAGTYEERVLIEGFSAGKLQVGVSSQSVTVRGIDIVGSSYVELNINRLTMAEGFEGNMLKVANGSNVHIARSMTIDCGNKSYNGISATYNSTVSAVNGVTITVNNAGGAVVMATNGSTLALYNVAGTNNLFGISASVGGVVAYENSTAESFMGDDAWGGGRIFTGAGVSALVPASVE